MFDLYNNLSTDHSFAPISFFACSRRIRFSILPEAFCSVVSVRLSMREVASTPSFGRGGQEAYLWNLLDEDNTP